MRKPGESFRLDEVPFDPDRILCVTNIGTFIMGPDGITECGPFVQVGEDQTIPPTR